MKYRIGGVVRENEVAYITLLDEQSERYTTLMGLNAYVRSTRREPEREMLTAIIVIDMLLVEGNYAPPVTIGNYTAHGGTIAYHPQDQETD